MVDIIGIVLGILGLFGAAQILRFLDQTAWRAWVSLTWSEARVRRELSEIVRVSTITFSTKKNASRYKKPVMVKHYIDLMSAVTVPKLKKRLDRCFLRWIHLSGWKNIDKIAVPKLGNVILALSIAQRLGCPLVIIRQDEDQFVRGGYSLDGNISAGERVLLVDDVSSDPEFLLVCCDRIQEFQAEVLGVICLVDRCEGGVAAAMKRRSLSFKSILQLRDREIGELVDINKPTAV